MGKKLFGAKGVFREVFGAGRVSKREASAAGYALEEWGKGHHKRKRKHKSKRKAKRHAFGGLGYMLSRKPKRRVKRRKVSVRKHRMPKRNSKGRFVKKSRKR